MGFSINTGSQLVFPENRSLTPTFYGTTNSYTQSIKSVGPDELSFWNLPEINKEVYFKWYGSYSLSNNIDFSLGQDLNLYSFQNIIFTTFGTR